LPHLNSRTSSIRSIQFAATKAAEKYFSSCHDSEPFLVEITKDNSESSFEKSFAENFFWDEEEVFNMPGLINSMVEGLLTTPPALQRGFNWIDGDTTMDLTLWEN
jgi:EREBP-like factor